MVGVDQNKSRTVPFPRLLLELRNDIQLSTLNYTHEVGERVLKPDTEVFVV